MSGNVDQDAVKRATPVIQISQSGANLYMLRWGEDYERSSWGPYQGAPGLDFSALAETYRQDSHAAAEAAEKDYCSTDENEFVQWLLEKEILSPVETTGIEVNIDTSSDKAYLPKHWPLCPECGEGRGEKEYGEFRRSLNRIKTFRRCTECRHEWGHDEEANDSSRPMLEDDGRDMPGACVPFAIGKACGIDFATVLKVCANHGWSSSGMQQTSAIVATRELGFSLTWKSWAGVGTSTPPTMKRLLSILVPGRNYVVGVKGHWLAIVDGQIVDNDANSGLGRKVLELYEVGLVQAIAA